MFKRVLIAVFIIVSSISTYAQEINSTPTQNLIIIRKIKSKKRAYYKEKQPIMFTITDSTYYGIINKIEMDSMLVDSSWIIYSNISTITNINPSSRHFFKQGSIKFAIAGVVFAVITSLNAIINNERPIFYRENLIPSAGLVGLGALMFPFRYQKYRLKRKWQIIVMPT